jgi:hypothetical protein
MIKMRREYIEKLKNSLVGSKVGQEDCIPKITVKQEFRDPMLPRMDQIPRPKHGKVRVHGLHPNNQEKGSKSMSAEKETSFSMRIRSETPFIKNGPNGSTKAGKREATEGPEDQRVVSQGNLYRRATNHIIDEYLRTSCIIK